MMADSSLRTVAGKTERVVVVGAGLAGLSAALHLAGRGRKVTVVERGAHPGGRVGRLDIDGYRLDTGPTVLTMPDIIDDAFAAVGELHRDRAGPAVRRSVGGDGLDFVARHGVPTPFVTAFRSGRQPVS